MKVVSPSVRSGLVVTLAMLVIAWSGPLARQASEVPPADRSALAEQVRAGFRHAWNGYKTYAWGHDELRPISRLGHDWYGASLYMTPIDALDTMYLMGMKDEALETTEYVVERLSFDKNISVSNFEITIRLLGGLLAVHQMTGDRRLLAKAEDLGARLLPAFDSPTGMPYRFVNLRTGARTGAVSNPAEVGTLVLEFGTLSKLTHRPIFFEKAKRALGEIYRRRARLTGLVGQNIDVETGEWTNRSSHIGGAIDSYYEYLVKCGRLFADADCAAMARTSLARVNRYVADDSPKALWYGQVNMDSGDRIGTSFGALEAFFPAVLAMSGDLKRARKLQDSSYAMWTLNGAEPEALDYRDMRIVDPAYRLRPEIAESAYYLFHYTNDPKYLEMGRVIFEDLERCCRVEAGYTVLTNVVTREQGDLQHSFFLAETLKYLYLLFSPEPFDFDHVVFNTEAHPLHPVP